MSSLNPKKGKFTKFISGKGFYVALAICLIGAGSAAWVAVDRTLNSMRQPDPNFSQNSTAIVEQQKDPVNKQDKQGTEETNQSVSGVEAPSSQPSSPSSSSSSQAPQSKPEESSKESESSPETQKMSYSLPIDGEIFGAYSNGKMVKNATLNDWRTHDGIDIKADKGTEVKAIADGIVTRYYEDPLWGYVVEIDHSNSVTGIYCGLGKEVKVKIGDKVKLGTVLGAVDQIPCEISLDSHLHFAVKMNGKYSDPQKLFAK